MNVWCYLNKYIVLLLLIFSSSSYLSGNIVPQDLEYNFILNAYRKGYYRQVEETFQTNGVLTNYPDMQYVLASSYLELQKYDKALEIYRKMDSDLFFKNKKYNHLYPFYVERYLQTIIKLENKGVLSEDEEKQLVKSIRRVPGKSVARASIDKLLFPVLWNENNFVAMMIFNNKNLTDEGKGWIELVKFKQNMPYDLTKILKVHDAFKKYDVYPMLFESIDPYTETNLTNLDIYTKMSIPLPDHQEKALIFAQRYGELAEDPEYYVFTQAAILEANKKYSDAAIFLYQYLKANPSVSKKFYQQTHAKLVRRKQFDLADDTAWLGQENHNLEFYTQLPHSIEYTKNANRALDWYQKNYTQITENAHNQVLRALIRLDLKKADQLGDIGMSENKNNPNFKLMRGLIKENLAKKDDAYHIYLDLMFSKPFSYEGIVARKKESSMRDQFRSIFSNYTENILTNLENYDLKDRLMIRKMMILDNELSNRVDIDKIRSEQAKFDKIVYDKLKNVPKIKALEAYDNDLTNFSIETMNTITNLVTKDIEKRQNYYDRPKYFYKYKDILLNSEIEGYLTFRLFFYARDYYGFSYFFNLPKDVLKLIFLRPCFNVIKENSDNNEDLAYWMLSSFLTESHFRKRVYSDVGAVGFAQVMPYTADDIKRWMDKPEFTNYDFLDNLRMGVYYHHRMYQVMDDNIFLSLAAYNAGPTAVRRWMEEYKDFMKDDYLFIEAIPYNETRNYVRQIVYNYNMYRTIYDYPLTLLYP
ncbi:MAG: lytic transglycosylase domain-containing protein [Brevinema sp.]